MMRTQKFWTRIYQKNIGKMVGACYRYVGDRAVAEDLAHEAFLKAIEKSDTYRRLGGFEAWLMRINLNTTLDYLRQPITCCFASCTGARLCFKGFFTASRNSLPTHMTMLFPEPL